MAFAVGTEQEKRQEKAVKGRYQKVAVGCWFTASGRALPQIVKYEDEDGCLQVLRDIQVVGTEQKHYAGVLSRRYNCKTVMYGQQQEFILLYNPETGIWDMVF